jgi:flavin-dependent dehydrogenase
MDNSYDAIVVGARCAGSPTAMLLARKGYRVLLLDRATFPSDTLSTHIVPPAGVAALARWNLLDRLVATGCPPMHTYVFDFGQMVISGSPGTAGSPVAYCPRRTVLDKLLADAAAEAGADVREGFHVSEVLMDDTRVVGITGHNGDSQPFTARARVVIGADGRNSIVARTVHAEEYNAKPPMLAFYYTYWSGLPMSGRFEFYTRPSRVIAVAETHEGFTMVAVAWPIAEFEDNKSDVEAKYLRTIDLAPALAKRFRGAKREARFSGAMLANFFRKPYGPGWALVGDAAYHKDAIMAQGITDSFREAERCADALDQALSGARPYDEALASYQRKRDNHVRSMYEFTCQAAKLEPATPQMQSLMDAICGRQQAMDAYVRMCAGTISPAEFLAPSNIAALMAA